MPELEGVRVQIGSREFIVPPITVEVYEQISTEPPVNATFADTLERVRVLLAANYPDLTVAELKKLIRLRDVVAVSVAVVKAAHDGMEVVEAAPGEAPRP